MCSLHLTHPSAHTWSSGQPTVQRPGSSRGPPAGARIRTHNLGLPRVSSPTLYPLGHDCPVLKCSLGVLLINCAYIITCADSYKMHLINQNLNEKVVHNSF